MSPSLSTLRQFKLRACAALGLSRWPQDLLRHTAASYLLALHGDAGKVATMLGNSSSVLLTHYHEPVMPGIARFFGQAQPPTPRQLLPDAYWKNSLAALV